MSNTQLFLRSGKKPVDRMDPTRKGRTALSILAPTIAPGVTHPDQRVKTEPVQWFRFSQPPRVHRLGSGGDALYVPVPAAVDLIKEAAAVAAVAAVAGPLSGLSDLNSLPTDEGQGVLSGFVELWR